jgi:hypothetical protein
MLGCLAAPVRAASDNERLVLHRVEKMEKIEMPKTLHRPVLLSTSGVKNDQYVVLSAALGSEGDHGLRYTWLYQVSENRLNRLFKLPFDATEMTGDQPPKVKGFFWVYDCYVCDSPEAGYFLKIPVVATVHKGEAMLTVDAAADEPLRLRKESMAVLDKALVKYGKTRKEPLKLKRQVADLFGEGLLQ